MCRERARPRRAWAGESGQTMSEYLALTGVTTAIAILTANVLGVQIRAVIAGMAQKVLQVITGYP
jgi:hypothetical protein